MERLSSALAGGSVAASLSSSSSSSSWRALRETWRTFGAVASPSRPCRKPRKLSQAKQVPLFPGMYKHVKRFEGEYVYSYTRHTMAIMRESVPFAVIPSGCLVPLILSWYPSCPVVPFVWQAAYLGAVLLVSRLVARGYVRRRRRDLTGRHAVVSGASSGMGRETAAQLAAMGADVTLIAKESPHAAQALEYVRRHAVSPEQQIEWRPLDLCDFIAVRDFCKRQRRQGEGIDILVNGAGVMHATQVMSRFGDDDQLAVNFLGPYLLTEGLLPLVAQTRGRIVYVTCSAHVGVRGRSVQTYLSGRGVWSPRVAGRFDGLEQYGFTKLGNLFHAQDLAVRSYPDPSAAALSRAKRHQIAMGAAKSPEEQALEAEPAYTVCAVNPGAVTTGLYRRVPLAWTFHYAYYVYLLVMRSAREGCHGIVNCCVREDLVNGGYYVDSRYKPAGLSAAACSVAERRSVLDWARKKMQPCMRWE